MYSPDNSAENQPPVADAPRARRAVSLRSRLTVWIAGIAVLAVAAVLLGGWLMYKAGLQDQRQALADQLRTGFQAQRSLLDRRALWLAALLEQTGDASSSELWRTRLKAAAGTFGRDGLPPPGQLALIDRRGQVIATWQPEGTVMAPSPCDSVRSLATRWRDNNHRRLGAGICARGAQAHYLVLVPLRAGSETIFLEVSSNLQPVIQGLEQNLQYPLRLARSDGPLFHQATHWPASGNNHLEAEWPIVADTGNKSTLVLGATRPVGALMGGLSEAGTLVLLMVLFAVISIGGLLYWYLERNLLDPLEALGARLRGVSAPVEAGDSTIARLAELDGMSEGVDRLDRQLAHAQRQSEQAAFLDPTTGLPNRPAFLLAIARAIQGDENDSAGPLALLVLDLDGFKAINDSLGLAAGDTLLRQVGERLTGKLRHIDVVARIGGDEFALLLPSADARQATTAARLLLQAMRQSFVIDGQPLDLGASIGIALYPDHGVDPYTLAQRADIALHTAKAGITGYTLYDPSLDTDSADRLILLSDLRRAIEQEQFELHYQPKVDLITRRVMGVEALIRWRHPREGLMLPGRFIPLLEQTGLIRSLMPWLANEAMRFARCLQELGHPLTVSINLSVRNLLDPQLADTLAEPLAAHHLDPSLIELEITESAVMDEPERACLMLDRLAQMGFRLAIDDFGTGYSSFSYLKRMPVNTIKIDKSFVLGMLSDSDDTAIVRTSIELAHHLGLQIVAEGVETAELLESLTGICCDSAQGYFLSRPLTSDALIDWVRHSSWGLGGRGERATAA